MPAVLNGPYLVSGARDSGLGADGIFADNLASELVTPTGSAAAGYAATFQIALAV